MTWPNAYLVFVAAFLCVIFAQGYLAHRALDNWCLALRREYVLAAALAAVERGDQAAIEQTRQAILDELKAQEHYNRNRGWWQRAPRHGDPWTSRSGG